MDHDTEMPLNMFKLDTPTEVYTFKNRAKILKPHPPIKVIPTPSPQTLTYSFFLKSRSLKTQLQWTCAPATNNEKFFTHFT